MNTEPSQPCHSPPLLFQTEEQVVSPAAGAAEPVWFSGFRTRALTMQDVRELPLALSRTEVSIIGGLEIEERVICREDDLESGIGRSESSGSLSSSYSSESGISMVSSEGSELEEAVPSGARLLCLPTSRDFIQSDALGNLLANLITGRLSEDEKLAISVTTLEKFCLQAMADLQYMVELSSKMLLNIHLLKVHETALKAIGSKIEDIQGPYRFLKEDIDDCLKHFLRGGYTEDKYTVEPLSMDHPEGKCRLVKTRTNFLDKLVCCWIYLLRNQEEWRKTMPAPEEIMKEAELPDPMEEASDSKSAMDRVTKLYKDSEKMAVLWKKLEEWVKPVSQQPGRRGAVSGASAPAETTKRLPNLISAPYGSSPHNATFTVECYQLPVAFDFGKSVQTENSEVFSGWVLPRNRSYETRTEEIYETRKGAEKALEALGQERQDNPEALVVERKGHEKAIVKYFDPVITRPVNYFEYQPVAINALEELVRIGKNNTRKVNTSAFMLQGAKFPKDRFSSRQKGEWRDLRKELTEKSCELWSLRIPSLQEAVDMICEERQIEEISRLKAEKKKRESSLRYQLEVGLTKISRYLRSPRLSPKPSGGASPVFSRGASPVPERRILHTQSSPELSVPSPSGLPPMKPRMAATLSYADLSLKLSAVKQELEVEQKYVPEIVIDKDPLADAPSMVQIPGLGPGALSPIVSESDSLTPEDLPTPKGSGEASPVAPGDDVETPMIETRGDPFREAFTAHQEALARTKKV